MKENLTQKILRQHLVDGDLKTGSVASIRIDQVLTQDATGTMAYLQFEAMQIPRIRVPLAVSYVDHGTLQTDFCNPDDHLYLQTAALKYGAWFSKPGNGICHQLHLERFAVPGETLLGSDSHTPTCGGMGMIAMGVGGLDIATVMAGAPYEMEVPKIVQVYLKGKLSRPWVAAMDVILEILRRLTVKGGVGKILEYTGPGVQDLSVTERATITNMGAELGATTSLFPSDERTRQFLRAQKREEAWQELAADEDASYDERLEIELNRLEPLMAKPHSPDNVVAIKEVAGLKVDQVCVGSCTNSSYQVMQSVARILEGRTVAPTCSLIITPGSKQVFEMIARGGELASLIAAGGRVLECSCGPCIGMGQAPPTGGVSVRSFNRNFEGRSGTASAKVYLCNPLAATVIAVKGEIVDPRTSGIALEEGKEPEEFLTNDNMLLPPADKPQEIHVLKGPNIGIVPVKEPLENVLSAPILLKVKDNVTTDDILPAGAEVLRYRSNIPAISEFVFSKLDKEFAKCAKAAGRGIIVGGENYGQGSSREHAALAPMYLGVRAVIAKTLARIHRANLINFGLFPLEFENPKDYERVNQGDVLEIRGLLEHGRAGGITFSAQDKTKGFAFAVKLNVTGREWEVLKAGGLLLYTKKKVMQTK